MEKYLTPLPPSLLPSPLPSLPPSPSQLSHPSQRSNSKVGGSKRARTKAGVAPPSICEVWGGQHGGGDATTTAALSPLAAGGHRAALPKVSSARSAGGSGHSWGARGGDRARWHRQGHVSSCWGQQPVPCQVPPTNAGRIWVPRGSVPKSRQGQTDGFVPLHHGVGADPWGLGVGG